MVITPGLPNQGFLEKIVGSIKGILIGIILFVVSIGMLYWNEGRVDLSNVSQSAIEINAMEQAPADAEGQLVSASGTLTASDQIGDLFLQPGDYVSISRNVEMYSWSESTASSTKTETGYVDEEDGATEPEYTYKKVWTSSPTDSKKFQFPTEHYNPPIALESSNLKASSAKVGNLELNLTNLQLPSSSAIALSDSNTILDNGLLTEDEEFFGEAFYETVADVPVEKVNSEYLFKGIGTFQSPEVGDIRISYSVVPANQQVTVFGQLSGNSISTYIGPKNSKLYRAFSGTHDESLSQMTTEHTQSTWGLRILGFILMWIGLSMLLGPISAVLDFVPLVGDLSRGVIGIATFIVAAVLSTIVIWISMILQNILLLILAVAAIIGVILIVLRSKGHKKK